MTYSLWASKVPLYASNLTAHQIPVLDMCFRTAASLSMILSQEL